MNRDSYGIYVHIPFCSQFCIYCDFYSVKQQSKKDVFLESLTKEILLAKEKDKIDHNFWNEIKGRGVRTIYFGGGTPSVLAAEQLCSLLHTIKTDYRSAVGGVKEITVEVNPDDASLSYLRELKKGGFNRLSIGIQSFEDAILTWMNRRHTAAEAIRAFRNARAAGFENISIDLIFGYQMLSESGWRDTINKALLLSPEHISAYQMGVERGTSLYRLAVKGEYKTPEDEVAAKQYRILQEMLAVAGYRQYEVSNFSKLGYESLHNSSYWDFTPYLGFGPSAHSFFGGNRWWNYSSLNRYISEISEGRLPCKGFEILDEKERFGEFIMLSLRTIEGINKRELESNYSKFLTKEFQQSVDKQKMAGNLVDDGKHIKIPPERLFISDGIIRAIY
jgi:putative oxygen-independent coproporphyrinogen III oxidase